MEAELERLQRELREHIAELYATATEAHRLTKRETKLDTNDAVHVFARFEAQTLERILKGRAQE